MRHELTRRTFIQQAACAGAVLASARAASAQSGMFLSLNGSLTRQLPWPDFVRLAGKVGYPGVDVQLGAARKDGVEATKALFKEAQQLEDHAKFAGGSAARGEKGGGRLSWGKAELGRLHYDPSVQRAH
jgi:hypothetical protein